MAQPKKKTSIAQLLKLVDQLSPEDRREFKNKLDVKMEGLTWSTVDLRNPAERERFFEQEDAKAGERVRVAFEDLQKKGIVDKDGKLLKTGLPIDMQPGSGCDVGG